MARLPVKKTYKLFIGGAFPRSRVAGAPTRRRGRTSRAPRARTCATPSSRGARRAAEVGGGDRLQPRPGALPDRRDDGGARGRVRGALQRPGRGRARDRPLASGTRASPTSSRRCSARRTRSPGRTSTSRSPSRPASSRVVAPDEPPLLGLVSRIAPALVGGNAVVAIASETQPLAAIELAEALATSDVPGGVVNLLTGYRDGARAVARVAHGRERDRPHRRRRAARRPRARPPPRTSSASCIGAPDGQIAARDLGLPRAEDRLAPDRQMTAFDHLDEIEPLVIWAGVIGRPVVSEQATFARPRARPRHPRARAPPRERADRAS